MSDPASKPYLTLSTRVAGVPVVDAVYPEGHTYPFHCDGRPRISVVLGGALLEEAEGQEVTASAASVVVKPADVRHRNTFGPEGARLLSVVAPTPLLRGYDGRGLDRWRWYHAGPVGRAAVRFVRAVRHTPEEAEDDLWGLLDAITAGPPARRPRPVPPWLLRARERLDDEVAGDRPTPSVTALAGDADVHPVALARAFRREFGCSPTAYRRRLRVRKATALLSSTGLTAVEVALAAGFADQSHMCRDVRTELGTTPGRLRRALRA